MARTRKTLVIVAASVATLLLALLVALMNLHWFRGPIERAITKATGRETHIRGELALKPLFPPTLRVGDVSFADAPWASAEPMFTARHIAVRPAFWRLVRGQPVFKFIEGDGLALRLASDEQGRANWQFGEPEPEDAKDDEPLELEIRRLLLTDSHVDIRQPALQTAVTLDAESAPLPDGTGNRLKVEGKGTYRQAPFTLHAAADVPQTIDADELAVDLSLDAAAGATKLHAQGRIPASITTTGATVAMSLSGDDLGDLYPLVGIAMPETPPYTVSGNLTWNPRELHLRELDGKIGDSSVRGEVDLALLKPRPKLTARLTSPLLDFDDLGALFGIPPTTDEGETASPEQKAEKARLQAKGRVLPDKPLDFSRLRAMDADVTLDAERIEAPKLPVRRMHAKAVVDDGVLRLDPVNFDAAGGKLEWKMTLDARKQPQAYDLLIVMRQLKLPELVPQAASLKDAVGAMSGKLELRGTGQSLAQMFATANGELQMGLGRGEVSNLLLEVAGLDVAEALKFLLGKDRKVAIRCGYADFGVQNGLATARALAIDTEDTALLGKGEINLGNERWDLTLMPKPKDKSPISLRTPLKIGGSFLDPAFGVEGGPLLLRGAAVAALAAIAPPAAILALIERGPGHDLEACGPPDKHPAPNSSAPADDDRAKGAPRMPVGPKPGPVTGRS